MERNYAKPNKAARRMNSIHNHNHWTDSLRLGQSKSSEPTDEMIRAGRIRRACEIIDEARQLGCDELLEVWEI